MVALRREASSLLAASGARPSRAVLPNVLGGSGFWYGDQSSMRASAHEAQVRRGEAADVGEDGGDIGRADAEPLGQRRAVLLDGGGGDPSAGAGVVGAVDRQGGEGAVELLA